MHGGVYVCMLVSHSVLDRVSLKMPDNIKSHKRSKKVIIIQSGKIGFM